MLDYCHEINQIKAHYSVHTGHNWWWGEQTDKNRCYDNHMIFCQSERLHCWKIVLEWLSAFPWPEKKKKWKFSLYFSFKLCAHMLGISSQALGLFNTFSTWSKVHLISVCTVCIQDTYIIIMLILWNFLKILYRGIIILIIFWRVIILIILWRGSIILNNTAVTALYPKVLEISKKSYNKEDILRTTGMTIYDIYISYIYVYDISIIMILLSWSAANTVEIVTVIHCRPILNVGHKSHPCILRLAL